MVGFFCTRPYHLCARSARAAVRNAARKQDSCGTLAHFGRSGKNDRLCVRAGGHGVARGPRRAGAPAVRRTT
eukprot:gene14404-biopygen2070